MNLVLNYIVLTVGLLISGSLWKLFSADDPEVKMRAKVFSYTFLVWGLLCYTIQSFAEIGVN